MTNALIPVSALAEHAGEPRIMDLVLAERLEMVDRHDVRRLIERNREELEMHGELFSGTVPENTGRRGRPGKAYWLNEGQALVICALSRTEKAAQVRKILIDVFMAWREGKLVHVREHRRKLPARGHRNRVSDIRDALCAFQDREATIIWNLARCLARIDELETRLDG